MIELATREQAGLALPKRPLATRSRDPHAISLHGQGDSNVAPKWLKKDHYWIKRIQQIHQSLKRGNKPGWRDLAYSISVDYFGLPVLVHQWDERSFAEGTLQRNALYDYPDFLPEPDGQASGNDWFLSILLECVGYAKKTIKPYVMKDIYGNDMVVQSTKGQLVPPSPAQLRTLDALIPHIREVYGRYMPVHGHGDHRVKDCPYDHLWAMIDGKLWDDVVPVPSLFDQEIDEQPHSPERLRALQSKPASAPAPESPAIHAPTGERAPTPSAEQPPANVEGPLSPGQDNPPAQGSSAIDPVSSFAEDAQNWVVENKISDGSRPRQFVTREEVWTMLERYNRVTEAD